MVNPKTVMESTHTLPEKSSQPGYVPFNKVQYIISTQKVEDNGYVSLNISWLSMSSLYWHMQFYRNRKMKLVPQ